MLVCMCTAVRQWQSGRFLRQLVAFSDCLARGVPVWYVGEALLSLYSTAYMHVLAMWVGHDVRGSGVHVGWDLGGVCVLWGGQAWCSACLLCGQLLGRELIPPLVDCLVCRLCLDCACLECCVGWYKMRPFFDLFCTCGVWCPACAVFLRVARIYHIDCCVAVLGGILV